MGRTSRHCALTTAQRPYVRKLKRGWWLGQRRYVLYMVRELTSLFVGVYCTDSLISLLEQLRAAPARALMPSILDPLVPPPRLQA